jgi:putative membrane protein
VIRAEPTPGPGSPSAARRDVSERSAVLTSATVQWRRLSPRMLLIRPIIEVGRALPAIVGAFLAGHGSGDNNTGSRWGLGVAVIVVVVSLLRWFTTRYQITADQIQVRHGLLRRKTMTAPIDRVRTVDVTSHMLHRLMGLSRVIVGTGTSDRKGRDRLVLDGLTADAAIALRAELLHRGGTGAHTSLAYDAGVTTPPTDETVEEELARVDPAWLRYAPFTLTGAVTGLALLGVAWRVVGEGRVSLRSIKPYRVVADQLQRWPVGVDVITVLVVIATFIAVASTVGYVLAFWHFRLSRHSGGTLHVSRGLITARATSIERRRLLGAELSEPLLLRWAGGARCLAIATGLRVGRGAERGGEILLPPAPRSTTVRVAAAVVEANAPFDELLPPHPIAARRRRILRSLAGALVIVAVIGVLVWLASWPSWLIGLTPVPVVAAVALGVDRYRSLGHARIAGFVVTSFGSIVRRRCVVDATGVIGWNMRVSFFQRRLGLTSLVATTAAGRQKYSIADVASGEAVRFADSAVPGLLTDFLVSPGE